MPALNVAHDPRRSFEIDPAILFSAIRTERAGGARILGYYHSHPAGDPTPSAADLAQACADGRIWLILAQGHAVAWTIGETKTFEHTEIQMTD